MLRQLAALSAASTPRAWVLKKLPTAETGAGKAYMHSESLVLEPVSASQELAPGKTLKVQKQETESVVMSQEAAVV